MILQGKENSLKFRHTSAEVVFGVMMILLKPTSEKKKWCTKANAHFFFRTMMTGCHTVRLHFKTKEFLLIKRINVFTKTGCNVAVTWLQTYYRSFKILAKCQVLTNISGISVIIQNKQKTSETYN